MRDLRRLSCWACWNEVDAAQCVHFAVASPLPEHILELVAPKEVCPVLCSSCLLAGVNLCRVDTQRARTVLPVAQDV